MRFLPLSILASAAAVVLLFHSGSTRAGEVQKIRPAAVAGSFYPADPNELGKMLDDFLSRAAPPPLENVVALVAPHAGYVYSGPVAAYSYALLKGRKVDRVVVIAPSHYEAFGFSSVYDGAAYTTPLGRVPVDQAFAAQLAKASPLIKLSGAGHTPSADKPEHSVEVQLPFLQRVLGQFQVVPIIMGDQSYDNCRALGLALAKLIKGTNTLIVASSDLSHYHTYDEAVRMDRKTLKGVEEWDYLNLSRNLELRVWEACGGGPIVAAMIASERLGASHAKLLKYANSGDANGDHSRVVGYGALAFVKAAGSAKSAEAKFSLTQKEKDDLLKIARKSVESAVRDGKEYAPQAAESAALAQERGAFVTLKEKGQLRGCIGYVAPIKPLYLTVRDVASLAALRDRRFRPVAAAELGALEYEISVLSPLRRVLDIKEIQVGEHGLIIRKGDIEGLLLPQVATEEKWDRVTFLEQTCYKAGLAGRAWQDADTDIFRFTAVVFGERKQLESVTAPDLFQKPGAWPSPPAPGSPSPTPLPF
ncbi:MAG TPA: AmmeMemoRadiSam system protein B [Bryobacteraceae bacterium]|nr:AmmeMemoRadiSam system protein B [Bryobacteraceae bacterium]